MKLRMLVFIAVSTSLLSGCLVDREQYVRYKGSALSPYQHCANDCARAHADADNDCSMSAWTEAFGGSHTSGAEGMQCMDRARTRNDLCESTCATRLGSR